MCNSFKLLTMNDSQNKIKCYFTFQHLFEPDHRVELLADVDLGARLAHPPPQDTRHQALR